MIPRDLQMTFIIHIQKTMKWQLTVMGVLQVKLFRSDLFAKWSSHETTKNSSYLHTLIRGSSESGKRERLLCQAFRYKGHGVLKEHCTLASNI